jgi:hypothetical protein
VRHPVDAHGDELLRRIDRVLHRDQAIGTLLWSMTTSLRGRQPSDAQSIGP